MFSDGYIKRTNHPLLRLDYPLRRLRLPQCRWIGNYYFMTHQSWIWVHKDFQQDEGVFNPQVIQVIIQSVLYRYRSLVESKGISDYPPYLFN